MPARSPSPSRTLWEPESDPAAEDARLITEERLDAGNVRGPYLIWVPPRGAVPPEEPGASDFSMRAQLACAPLQPGGRTEIDLPVHGPDRQGARGGRLRIRHRRPQPLLDRYHRARQRHLPRQQHAAPPRAAGRTRPHRPARPHRRALTRPQGRRRRRVRLRRSVDGAAPPHRTPGRARLRHRPGAAEDRSRRTAR